MSWLSLMLLICAVGAVVSLPHVFRLVPPNAFYGFRTKFSRSSREAWYATNAFAGRAVLVASLFSALALAVLELRDDEINIAAALLVVPATIALGASLLYARAMEKSGRFPPSK